MVERNIKYIWHYIIVQCHVQGYFGVSWSIGDLQKKIFSSFLKYLTFYRKTIFGLFGNSKFKIFEKKQQNFQLENDELHISCLATRVAKGRIIWDSGSQIKQVSWYSLVVSYIKIQNSVSVWDKPRYSISGVPFTCVIDTRSETNE